MSQTSFYGREKEARTPCLVEISSLKKETFVNLTRLQQNDWYLFYEGGNFLTSQKDKQNFRYLLSSLFKKIFNTHSLRMLYDRKRPLLVYRTHKIMILTSVPESIHRMLSVLRLSLKWKKGLLRIGSAHSEMLMKFVKK